ncbi:hypothetical protein HDC91_002618 [Mucilaginibacter sp. AK015]|nr:hypothetical protein [Mucilaginibacter sp. AK015]
MLLAWRLIGDNTNKGENGAKVMVSGLAEPLAARASFRQAQTYIIASHVGLLNLNRAYRSLTS